MLDVDLKWGSAGGGGGGGGAAASLLPDEDTMDEPLFDNDWLHEHNLDILFDLFEEELGDGKDSEHQQQLQAGGALGSSPITSYLFGNSVSLASTLDLYDLLYFDGQAASNASTNNSVASTPSAPSAANPQAAAPTTVSSSANQCLQQSAANPRRPQQAATAAAAAAHKSGCPPSAAPLSAMRIKRRLKRGQSEGVSLLARPGSCAHAAAQRSEAANFSTCGNTNSDKSTSNTSVVTNSNADRLSAGIDISHSPKDGRQQRQRHLHHHHQHVHYITGCSIIREHAYALRAHHHHHHSTIQIN